NKLTIGVFDALLVKGRLRAASANDGVCRFTKDQSDAASGQDYGIRRKCLYLKRSQIHRRQTAAMTVVVLNHLKHFPMLKLANQTFGFVTPNLFVQSIQQLLSGRSTGKCGAVMFSAAKSAEIDQTF